MEQPEVVHDLLLDFSRAEVDGLGRAACLPLTFSRGTHASLGRSLDASSWLVRRRAPPPCRGVRRPAAPAAGRRSSRSRPTPRWPGSATPHRHPGVPVYPGPYPSSSPTAPGSPSPPGATPGPRATRPRAGYAVTKRRLRRLAVRRPARRRGAPVASALQVGQGRAAGRRARAADEGRRACPHRSGSRRARSDLDGCPAPATGPARPGHPGVLRQPGQRRQHRGPVGGQDFFGAGSSVSGYYQANSFGKFALVPAAESGGVANNGVVGWLQLPYDHPNFGNDYGAAETKLGVDAVTAADPYVDYASFDTDEQRRAQRLRAARHGDRRGLRDVVRRLRATSAATASGATRAACTTRPRSSTAPSSNRSGGTMFGEWMCTPEQRARPDVDDRDHGPRDGPRHRLPRPLRHRLLQRRDRGQWSADVGGSWNRVGTAFSGTTPAGMDAFSKSYQGWLTPTPVVGALNGAAAAVVGDQPHGVPARRNPDDVDWKFEIHRARASTSSSRTASWSAATPASPPAA